MTRSEAKRAGYERERAFRQRAIKRLQRSVEERMLLSGSDAEGLPPASFSLLYESRDGRLCFFEDAQGHVSAVNSARLA